MRLFTVLFLGSMTFSTWANEVNMAELKQTLNNLSQRLDQQVQITPAQFRWKEWERFEQELNFVVAHDPVADSGSVPEELQSETLNQRLYARWDDLVISATQMGLTRDNAAWSELEESMKRFFQHREDQMYRLARAQMKTGEIREVLVEVFDQAAEKAIGTTLKPEVKLTVLDPAIVEASKALKNIDIALNAANKKKEDSVEVSYLLLGLTSVAFLALCALSLWGWTRKPKVQNLEVQKPALKAEIGTTEEWMNQLEGTLSRQQNLEVQQEEEIRKVRELISQLKTAVRDFKNSSDPKDFYLNLEKIEISTQAIDRFIETQDPMRFAEVPYLLTKLILSMSETVEQRTGMLS